MSSVAMKFRFLVLALLLVLPLLALLVPSGDVQNTENRTMAESPSWAGNVKQYTSDWEKYFNDHFSLRGDYIKAYCWLVAKVFKTSPTPVVLMGKDGWLFYWSENDPARARWEGNTFDDFRGRFQYSIQELDRIKSKLENFDAAVTSHGAKLVFVVGPNQASVNADKVPDRFYRSDERSSRLAQITEHLAASGSKVRFVNPTAVLTEARAEFPTYWKTDTHWNDFGAFLTYRQAFLTLTDALPSLTPLTRDDIRIKVTENVRGREIANMMSLADFFPDQAISVKVKTRAHSNKLRKALVFGDSFYARTTLKRLVGRHFNEVSYRHHGWKAIDRAVIRKEKPDVVFVIAVERLAIKLMERL